MNTLYQPDLLYADGRFRRNSALPVDLSGKIMQIRELENPPSIALPLKGRAVLPGFVNVHSHSFQRLIRGKSESRVTSGNDFWSWRGTMYHAAAALTPEDVYDVARMAFLEMVHAGTTTVGEFHYLHSAPDGRQYDDPNLLSRRVIAGAQSVGIRIVMLRAAYLRSGYQLPPDPGQARFFETAAEFIQNSQDLLDSLDKNDDGVRLGIAPHSIRAVPLDDLHSIADWAREKGLPLHMHVAEQVAENQACVREYGLTPVALLHREKLLGADFTAVHAIHITEDEIGMLATAHATICSCPTTERNLGDGIFPADKVMRAGIRVALGSDSQAQIDPLEDARQIDYHLRLSQQQRAILDQIDEQSLPLRLLHCAATNGAEALNINAGALHPGAHADFFTIDVNDPSVAGHSESDLLPIVVFGLNRTAIKDVFVNGRQILHEGKHALEEEIVTRYKAVHQKVWGPVREHVWGTR